MGTHFLIELLFTSHLRHQIIITCLFVIFIFNCATLILIFATATSTAGWLLMSSFLFSLFFPLLHFTFLFLLSFPSLFFSFHFIAVGDNYHESFVSANQTFFECVIPHLKQDDVVWVHDYHLMLLPKLLREAELKISIVFYLHIPFPTSQIFRALPSANELLQVRTWTTHLFVCQSVCMQASMCMCVCERERERERVCVHAFHLSLFYSNFERNQINLNIHFTYTIPSPCTLFPFHNLLFHCYFTH